MRSARACFATALTLMVFCEARGADGLPYEQKKDVVYGEAHGTGLLMDVFTPTGKPNGLGIVESPVERGIPIAPRSATIRWRSTRSSALAATWCSLFGRVPRPVYGRGDGPKRQVGDPPRQDTRR